MKSLFKQILPKHLANVAGQIYNISNAPYRLSSNIKLPSSISDAFICSFHCSKLEFIAENIRALLLRQSFEVKHLFTFYSADGQSRDSFEAISSNFVARLSLNLPDWNDKYCMFTHQVVSNLSIKQILSQKKINNRIMFCEQSRGYTIYYPHQSIPIGGAVHGNFGAISADGNLLAVQRAKHLYSPAYYFSEDDIYDLVFVNPTNQLLDIFIFKGDNPEPCESLAIPSMCTRYFKLENFSGSLSLLSRLPICRPVIFKNPAPNALGTFDVFHS